MKLFRISAAILALLALSATGCKKDTTVFSVDVKTIEVSFSGGEYSFGYVFQGQDNGIQAGSEQDWINGFDTTEPGIVSFNVDPNPDTGSREGSIQVRYASGGDIITVTVLQAGNNSVFDIACSSTSSSVIYRVIPADKGMTYMYSMMDKATFDSYDDKMDICNEEIARLKENADMFGKPLEEYLRGILHIGDSPVMTEDLLFPDSEFYVYAYGLDADGTVTVPLSGTAVSTKPLEKIDAGFDISNVQDGNIVTVVVDPAEDDQRYLRGTVLKSVFTDTFFADLQNEIFEEVRSSRNSGMSDNSILSSVSEKGRTSEILKLETETDYVSYAVAIDGNFLLVSDPVISEFSTSAIEVSDNKLTISISELHGHFVRYKVSTTNSDNYVLFIKRYSEWEGLSDDEIIQSLTLGKDISSLMRSGDTEGFARELYEETAYALVAFGYNNKKPTTGLTKFVFTTPEAQTSPDGRISISFDKYFDGSELESMYPGQFASAAGKAVLPVRPVTEGYLIHYHYQIFEGDLTDKSTMSDDAVAEQLLESGVTDPSADFILDYGKTYTLMAFGVDFYEDYTPVYRQTVVLGRDGISPADEYGQAR